MQNGYKANCLKGDYNFMIKKILRILMITILVSTTLMLSACSGFVRNEEWGYFTVKFYDDRETAYITGLTEEGQQQRFLVIPEVIDGVKVSTIGERPLLQMWSSIGSADIRSEKLEKVYFPTSVYVVSGSFRNSPNLTKIISMAGAFIVTTSQSVKTYVSDREYTNVPPNSLYYYAFDRANVSFFYNYETEKNYGYYWIDDYDYGSKIEFIPPEPEREGYTFGGWYKEPECINKWDFETDVLPEERTEINEDGEKEVVYQETKLYAKWL